MAFTFRGGTHVAEYKNTKNSPIEVLPTPRSVSIPMSQHIGAHCKPIVKVGDTVFKGQVIGEIEGGLGCPIHSSVSGIVTAITSYNNAQGKAIVAVIIEPDGEDTLSPDVKPVAKKLTEVTTDEIIEIVKNAGIAGMGGAAFPTYAKIQSAVGKVDKLIINCAECEPFITANHRLMLERPTEILNGAKILLKALGLRQADIAVEDNKPDAISVLEDKIGESKMLRVCEMKTKYPQGDERQLIYALYGREMPKGKLPSDVGCVIFNAETCAAIYRAFALGMPLVERVVTVDGDCVVKPRNLLVPIGASYKDLIDACGGLKKTPKKIISGGPMMGFAQWDHNAPITKGTSSILVFSEEMCPEEDGDFTCIRCGRCVKNCPMHLVPSQLALLSQHNRYDETEAYNVECCVECGTCSYNCPGHVPIVQHIRVAKGVIRARTAAARSRNSQNVPDIRGKEEKKV